MNADQIAGEKIHLLMRRRGIAQAELAPHLGIDQSSMSKKLYGKRTWTLDELLTVARVLDVPITDLLPDDEYAPVPAGRGRMSGVVRLEGLEPPTFWLVANTGADDFWTVERVADLGVIECQAYLDTVSHDNEVVS